MTHLILFLYGCANWRAPELCEDLFSKICSGCTDTLAKAECISELDAHTPCEKAVDVSAQYDDCLVSLDSSTCLLFDELPASCRGAVLVR